MNNVIYVNEKLIGTKKDIWKYFKEEINRQLEDNAISFEELKDNINAMLDVMEKIQENENIYEETLLSINEYFGGFNYKVLEEVD